MREDPGPATPWARPRPDSNPLDLTGGRPFAEMTHGETTMYLRRVLRGPPCPPPTRGGAAGSTLQPGPAGVRHYWSAMRDLRRRLPDGFHIVFHRWTSHESSSSAGGGRHWIGAEVVLYRDGKSHGKHVSLEAAVSTPRESVAWDTVAVLGNVINDRIQTFGEGAHPRGSTPAAAAAEW